MDTLHHRLAAVWFADIVGFTGMTRQDESRALQVVRLFQELAREKVRRHGGHLVKFTGDGALAEFGSTESAVLSAWELRRDFIQRSVSEGLGTQNLCVGIHLGEIAGAPDGDVYGEGVNVAARILEQAEPGQVVVGSAVQQQLHHRRQFEFQSLGERELRGCGTFSIFAVAVEGEEGAATAERRRDESRVRALLSELSRRRVFTAVALYTVLAVLVAIVAVAGFRAFFLPDWLSVGMIAAAILGLPLVIALAWMFELTAEGVRRHRPSDAGRGPWERSPSTARVWPIVLAAAVVAAVLVGLAVLAKRWPFESVPTSPSRMVVLPFSVRGGPEIQYLGEGMVDLLSTKLDGVGDYHSVDPHAVLEFVNRNRWLRLTPDQGNAVAGRFGAGYYILGNVVEAGDRIHLDASMYQVGRPDVVVAQVSVQGEAADLMNLVDQLVAMLLAARLEDSGAALTSIAAMTTDSLSALKAYLDGEREYKAGRFTTAVEAFQRAVAIDSLFSLAYYRLGISATWIPDYSFVDEAAEKALRHSDRLSPPDRTLVEAFHALQTIQPERVASLLRPYLNAHPDDVEAWYIYGDALYHYNALRGRSISEAREPFERALALDPDNNTLANHLIEIAASEGDFATLDSLLQGIDPGSEFELQWRALSAFARGGDTRAMIGELRQASDYQLRLAVQKIAGYSPRGRGLEEVVNLMLEPGRPPDIQRGGRLWRIQIAVREGRWEEAKTEIAALRSQDPARAVHFHGLYAALPFLPVTGPELSVARSAVLAWNPRADDDDRASTGEFDPLYRQYLIGLLSVRLGDRPRTVEAREALDQWEGSPQQVDVARFLSRNLEAHDARANGRREAALQVLSEPAIELRELPSSELYFSPFIWHPYERFARAELLFQEGQLEEAIGWYQALTEGSSWLNLPYAPLSHLRLATIYDRMDDPARAAEHYSSFIDYWKACDAELQPQVAEARRRLALAIEQAAAQ